MQKVDASDAWFQNLLNEVPDAAWRATHVRVERIDAMDKNAVGVWREYGGGRYAALIANEEIPSIWFALDGEWRAENG